MFNFIGEGILLSVFLVAAWIVILKKLSASAPEVTDKLKGEATKKAISLIGRWLK